MKIYDKNMWQTKEKNKIYDIPKNKTKTESKCLKKYMYVSVML